MCIRDRSHSLRVCLIPGPGQGEVTVRGEHHIGDEVTKENEDQDDTTRVKISSPVSVKSLRNSIVSNIVPDQLPDNAERNIC